MASRRQKKALSLSLSSVTTHLYPFLSSIEKKSQKKAKKKNTLLFFETFRQKTLSK